MLFKSLSIADHPDYAVVTNSTQYGVGVYSWHISKEEALHNARIVQGVVVPVDYMNGELITPPLAKAFLGLKL